jgi:hypothetical protein
MIGTYVLWYYTPSLAAGVIFAAAFGVLTLSHLVLRVRNGAKYCNCLIVGAICK